MNWLRGLPKEKQQKLLLAGIGFVMVMAALYQFYLAKNLTALSESRQKSAELAPKVDRAEQRQKESIANTPLKESMQAFLKTQKPRLVTGDSFSWTCREISLLAEKHPVKIVSLRPGTVATHPRQSGYQTFTTKIELAGAFDDLGAFLRALENKFPAGEIRALQISSGQREGGDLIASLDLMLIIQPDPTTEKKS